MSRYSKLKEEMKETIMDVKSQLETEMQANHSVTQERLKESMATVNEAIPKAVNEAVFTDRENRKKQAM